MSSFLDYESFQSGFKIKHSTESALLRVTNDLRNSASRGHVSMLILLDLSSAFDTIDHSILIGRLKTFIGLSGSALDWFTSYLSNRSFQVRQSTDISDRYVFQHGVPQGSVLGPILFRIYILPLLALLSSLDLSFHCFADDTQIYIPCTPHKLLDKIESFQTSYNTVSYWLSDNFLKLNHSKTEIVIIGTPNSVSKCKTQTQTINIGGSDIVFSPTARNLGITFDESLSFLPHIQNCRKQCFALLSNLRTIRSHFNRPNFESIIHAFITLKLDYCNSLFSNLPNSTLRQLQSIQNYAARLVLCRNLYSHVTPLLFDLHWLPVQARIKFKILLFVYKAIHQSSPPYLTSLLRRKANTRNLRHHDPLLLEIPRSHSCRMGDRAFAVVGPSYWNDLPYRIRNSATVNKFKSALKNHLFLQLQQPNH